METFSALLALCADNSTVTGEFSSQRPMTRSFDVFFDLCLNKRLSKQSWGWWFETPSRPLWRHCDDRRIIQFSDVHSFIHCKCLWLIKNRCMWYIVIYLICYILYVLSENWRNKIVIYRYNQQLVLGAIKTASHYLKQCWHSSLTHMCVRGSPSFNAEWSHVTTLHIEHGDLAARDIHGLKFFDIMILMYPWDPWVNHAGIALWYLKTITTVLSRRGLTCNTM